MQQPACATNGQAKRELWLRLGKVFRAKEVVGQRLHAEVEDENGVHKLTPGELGSFFLLLVVAAAWFFYPIWTGEVIPYQAWRLRMWMPTWT